MTEKELLRLQTAQRVLDGGLSLVAAAATLQLSTRQVKRLTRRLRLAGAGGFCSARRSKPPNNAFDETLKERVLELARSDYAGFGPTFLAEKIAECQQMIVNRETLRHWLIAANLHRPRKRRQKPRPLRERRARFGELVQADGSPHRWFEDRGDPCTLLLCVDDATTTILGGLFNESESTNGYFELFERTFTQHGLPRALYTDRHGIFRINLPGARPDEETQVQRALRELDVELICANSPQAKGRVERANRTLQDRLVKELRLQGISTIAAANDFLPTFFASFNARFSISPRESDNAHRAINENVLRVALTKQYDRLLTKDLTFQINDTIYAIDPSSHHRLHSKMRIAIHVPRGAQPFTMYQGRRIESRLVGVRQRTAQIVDSKQLNTEVDRRIPNPKKAHMPPKTHPWKAGYDPALAAEARARRGHL